ncbi:MAG: TDP-N-acetylfucosamine:lipid II N-acetylfucosaminyltransferase [Bacteroidales bacterium]|nr:TDP-N-acetylfucosamine:lipid II N-acetylfucosaminyltransferase [Bacteroidales bacterium]
MKRDNNILFISSDIYSFNPLIKIITEVAKKNVEFIVVSDNLQYIKIKKIFAQFPYNYYYNDDFIKKLNRYKVIVFLGLLKEHVYLINKIKKDINVLWIFIGADGLYINKFKNRWETKETKDLISETNFKNRFIQKIKDISSDTLLYELYYCSRNGYFTLNHEKLKAIKRVDYIAPVIEDDYYILKRSLKIKAELIPFSIGSLKTLLNDETFKNSEITRQNILLGNSADPTNNHINIFNLLNETDFNGKIICPLSYGNEKYRDIIIRKGKQYFGDQFYPLLEFMPIKEYQKIINSCSIIVMNHLRQQAMGNINSGLYQGKKVFLNDNNYTRNFYDRIGVITHSIQKELKKSIQDNDFAERDSVVINNRIQLEKHYSHEAVLKKTETLLKTISKGCERK